MSIYDSKGALGFINFQFRGLDSNLLFKKLYLPKFEEKNQLENLLLVSKCFSNILPSNFDSYVPLCSDICNYKTTASSTGKLFKASFKCS